MNMNQCFDDGGGEGGVTRRTHLNPLDGLQQA